MSRRTRRLNRQSDNPTAHKNPLHTFVGQYVCPYYIDAIEKTVGLKSIHIPSPGAGLRPSIGDGPLAMPNAYINTTASVHWGFCSVEGQKPDGSKIEISLNLPLNGLRGRFYGTMSPFAPGAYVPKSKRIVCQEVDPQKLMQWAAKNNSMSYLMETLHQMFVELLGEHSGDIAFKATTAFLDDDSRDDFCTVTAVIPYL